LQWPTNDRVIFFISRIYQSPETTLHVYCLEAASESGLEVNLKLDFD
jgi:hypothetical protein